MKKEWLLPNARDVVRKRIGDLEWEIGNASIPADAVERKTVLIEALKLELEHWPEANESMTDAEITALRADRDKWRREHRAMSKGAQTNAEVAKLALDRERQAMSTMARAVKTMRDLLESNMDTKRRIIPENLMENQ